MENRTRGGGGWRIGHRGEGDRDTGKESIHYLCSCFFHDFQSILKDQTNTFKKK